MNDRIRGLSTIVGLGDLNQHPFYRASHAGAAWGALDGVCCAGA